MIGQHSDSPNGIGSPNDDSPNFIGSPNGDSPNLNNTNVSGPLGYSPYKHGPKMKYLVL